MLLWYATSEFVVLLGFGAVLLLFSLLLFIKPRLLWNWDRMWLKRIKGYNKKQPPANYDARQTMAAIITFGYGVTLVLAAMFTILIYQGAV